MLQRGSYSTEFLRLDLSGCGSKAFIGVLLIRTILIVASRSGNSDLLFARWHVRSMPKIVRS